MNSKHLKIFLWTTAAGSALLAAFSLYGNLYIHAGGEPYFPLYGFLWSIEPALLPTQFIAGATAIGSLITLAGLAIQKANRIKPSPTWTKLYKYNQMRTFALLIAGLPGLIMLPFIVGLISLLFPETPARNTIGGFLAIVSLMLLWPGIMAMVGMLTVNLITLARKTVDPESTVPKTHQLQIVLAIVAAAMPAWAFLAISRSAFSEECQTNCNIFYIPEVIPMATIYLIIWIALTAIWLKTKPSKTTA